MTTKLYVGKLSYDTTEAGLKDLFATYGEVVSAALIMDRATNRSKGFGFVELSDDAAAQKAVAELDGKDFEGRTIVVNVAKPKEDTPRRDSNFKRSW